MSAADAVKRVRSALNLDKKDFAMKLGISKTAINNYESSIRVPKRAIVEKMQALAKEKGIILSKDEF